MTNNLFLYSYKVNSQSVNNLKDKLKIKSISIKNSRFKGRSSRTVINWGASKFRNSEVDKCTVLNPSEWVNISCNKLKFFRHQNQAKEKANLLEFTTDTRDVIDWLRNKEEVIGRTFLRSHSGRGIVFITEENLSDYTQCELFTKYQKKKDEYRIHIFQGDIILEQRKTTKFETEPDDYRIRTHKGGYIYSIQDLKTPNDVLEQAILAWKNSNLDFGAVDILWNAHYKKATVCEINTAPGLQGSTLDAYYEKFKQFKE